MTPPRRRCRFRRRRDLVERLAPYVQPIEAEPEPLISVVPIRWWLEGWAAATGDRPDVIAQGFGLDPGIVHDLLDREARFVRRSDAAAICRSLGLDPAVLPGSPQI